MASYRPFPPQPPPSNFGPPPPRGNMYPQMWNYPNHTPAPLNPNFNQPQQYSSYPPLQPPQQPPPPLQPPQQPPGQMYFPPSQYSQFNNQPPRPPPPPPPSSPPNSSIPPPPPLQPPSPPPPPSSVSATNETKEHRQIDHKESSKDPTGPTGLKQSEKVPAKEHAKPSSTLPPVPVRTGNRGETEEERRSRKKREMEKRRHEEKHRKQLKESQNKKTQMLSSTGKLRGSISGSHMGERRATPFLSGERGDNRLKKPTTFLCKLKFRDELPDLTAQPKLLSLHRDKDRAAKYATASLEKVHKPQLYVEPDLGIPLDLLDLSVYNGPKVGFMHVAPEDGKLLEEDISMTPLKKDGLKRKERPTDKGMSWLVKTQYISPLSTEATRQSLSEKQAKELRETRELILHSSNNRERTIQDIEASFEACKSPPVHATNKKLHPTEILPLFPDFERWNDQLVVATFDGAPTADSEIYSKLDKSVRDAHESQALMKSFVASTSSSANKPDKFLAYMVPSVGELSKDVHDENEDKSYTWVREYHWDVRGEDADDPTSYLVAFGESEARYTPLPTKLILRKKRAREGKTSDEVEHFRVPASITVRPSSTVSVEMIESESYVGSKRRISDSRHHGRMVIEDVQHKGMQDVAGDGDMDQFSGAEDDMSD